MADYKLFDGFKEMVTEFLSDFGIENHTWVQIGDSKPRNLYTPFERIIIHKQNEVGFDVILSANEDVIFPSVEGLDLVPLDTMGGRELLWSKRFLLSVLSSESELVVRRSHGVEIRRSLTFVDPQLDMVRTFSRPWLLYPFWKRGEIIRLSNAQIDVSSGLGKKQVDETESLLKANTSYFRPQRGSNQTVDTYPRLERLIKMAEILEAVVGGTLEGRAALRMWPDFAGESDDRVANVWHILSHFADDSDIRQKSPEYGQIQKKQLEDGLSLIRKLIEKQRE